MNTQAFVGAIVESAPLWVAVEVIEAGQYDAVVVLSSADDTVLGILRRDSLLRLAERLSDVPVRMLPLQKAVLVNDVTADCISKTFADESVQYIVLRRGPSAFSLITRAEH